MLHGIVDVYILYTSSSMRLWFPGTKEHASTKSRKGRGGSLRILRLPALTVQFDSLRLSNLFELFMSIDLGSIGCKKFDEFVLPLALSYSSNGISVMVEVCVVAPRRVSPSVPFLHPRNYFVI
jgi:hypothetical protein